MAQSLPCLQQVLNAESARPSATIDDGAPDLRGIIQRFDELPTDVREARFTRVDERCLDHELMTALVTQLPPFNADDWPSRLRKREESLLPYVGKVLICVFIRLPGVHYTIEVDPRAGTVVHWEWQTI